MYAQAIQSVHPVESAAQRSLLYDGIMLNAFSRISLALSVNALDANSPLGEGEIALTAFHCRDTSASWAREAVLSP